MAAARTSEMLRMGRHGIDRDDPIHRMGEGSGYEGEGVFEEDDEFDDEIFEKEDEDDELPDDEEDDEAFGEGDD